MSIEVSVTDRSIEPEYGMAEWFCTPAIHYQNTPFEMLLFVTRPA